MQKYELNLWDYWRIIRKRRSIVILTAIIIPVITFAVTWVRRPIPVYETTASVRVERSMSMTGLFVEMLSVPSGDMLATQALIIKSFPVLEKVAKEMNLIPQDIQSDQIYANEKYANVLSVMQGEIRTEIEGTTNIINITVTSGDPQRAYKTANLVSEKYMEENIILRNKQIFEAKKFIEEQLKVVEGKLTKSEDALNEYKRQKDVISITEEQKIAVDKFSKLETNVESTDREIKETEYDLALFKKGEFIPGTQTTRFFFDSGNNQPVMTGLNLQLGELLLQRNNLLINSTATHPEVKELDAKIANIRTEITAQLESKRNALMKKADIFSGELNRFKSSASFLPSTAMDLSRIERDVKINQELFSLLKTKYQEALIKEAEKIEEVSIIKRATEPKFSMNPPKFFLNTLLGVVIGMILGLVFAFIFESLDTSIGTLEDVEEFLDIPVIGSIPNMNIDKADDFLRERYSISTDYRMEIYRALISHSMPKSIVAESYRSLRTNALFVAAEKNIKSIMITSSSMHEGKTTTAINLALTLAQIGKRVLLIDVDFRSPSIHHYFGLEKDPGLSDVLLGNNTWKEVGRSIADIMMGEIKVDDIMANPGMDNLNLITSGSPPAHPAEFLNSPIVPKLLNEIAEHYDFVILDSPPVMPVADPIILGSKVDGVFIVYKVGIISRYALKRAKLLLENVGAKVLGTILNDFKAESSPDFFQGTYYQYARKEEFANRNVNTVTESLNSLLQWRFKRKNTVTQDDQLSHEQKKNDRYNKVNDNPDPDRQEDTADRC
jgi:capsular exopolysaccharide synthesis family protein